MAEEFGNNSGSGVQPAVEPANSTEKLRDRLIKDFQAGMGYKEASAKEKCSWQYAYTVFRRFSSAKETKPEEPQPKAEEKKPEEEKPEIEIEEKNPVEKEEKPRPPSEKMLAKRQEILKDMLMSTNVFWKHLEADELSEAEAESVAAVWSPFVDPRQMGMIWAGAFTALVFAPRIVQAGGYMVSKVTKKGKGQEEKEKGLKSETPQNMVVMNKNENAQ